MRGMPEFGTLESRIRSRLGRGQNLRRWGIDGQNRDHPLCRLRGRAGFPKRNRPGLRPSRLGAPSGFGHDFRSRNAQQVAPANFLGGARTRPESSQTRVLGPSGHFPVFHLDGCSNPPNSSGGHSWPTPGVSGQNDIGQAVALHVPKVSLFGPRIGEPHPKRYLFSARKMCARGRHPRKGPSSVRLAFWGYQIPQEVRN